MKRYQLLTILLLFLFVGTGCTAEYTLDISHGTIQEKLTVLENNLSVVDVKDDAGWSFRDYAKHYGSSGTFYQDSDNMYTDEDSYCVPSESNYCTSYEQEYINNQDELGFSLTGEFSYEDYQHATIPNEMVPGFTVMYDGTRLRMIAGGNWNQFQTYSNLEGIRVTIHTNYRVEMTNASSDGKGNYVWYIPKTEKGEYPNLYMTLDTTVVNHYSSDTPSVVTWIILGAFGVAVLVLVVYFLGKAKKNNRV